MVDEFHFSRVVCVVEGFEDGFSNVDKGGLGSSDPLFFANTVEWIT